MLGNVKERSPQDPSPPADCPANGFPATASQESLQRTAVRQDNERPHAHHSNAKSKSSTIGADDERSVAEADANAMLANMSADEMNEALHEVYAHLSEQSIQYLHLRSRQQQKVHQSSETHHNADISRDNHKDAGQDDAHSAFASEASASDVRFDLQGQPIGTKRTKVHSHIPPTERDQLRAAGAEQDSALGYTLNDAIKLARSAVPQQRTAALQLLTNVCSNCHDAIASGQTQCCGDVSWQAVFRHAFCNLRLLRSAKAALSEQNSTVVSAAASLLEQVTRPPPSASTQSAASAEGHSLPEANVPEQPLWRNKRGQRLEPLAEGTDDDDPLHEASDPVAALIRMSAARQVADMISSLSFPPMQAASLLGFLCRCARHSMSACTELTAANRLVPVLVETYAAGIDQCEFEGSLEAKRAEARSRERAIELLRLIAQTTGDDGKSLFPEDYAASSLHASMQHAVLHATEQSYYQHHVRCREPLSLWRTLSRMGLHASSFDDYYQAFEFCLVPTDCSDIPTLGLAKEVFWTLAASAKDMPVHREETEPVLTWHCAGNAASLAVQWLSPDIIKYCFTDDGTLKAEVLSTVSAALSFIAIFMQKRNETISASGDDDVPPGFHEGIHAFLHGNCANERVCVLSETSTLSTTLASLSQCELAEVDTMTTQALLAFLSATVSVANQTKLAPPDFTNVESVVDILETVCTQCAMGAADSPTPSSIQSCVIGFNAVSATCSLCDTFGLPPVLKVRIGSLAAACGPPGREKELLNVIERMLARIEVANWVISDITSRLDSCKQSALLDDGDQQALKELDANDAIKDLLTVWENALFSNRSCTKESMMTQVECVEGSLLPFGTDWLMIVRAACKGQHSGTVAFMQSFTAVMWRRKKPQVQCNFQEDAARILSSFVALDESIWRLSGAARSSVCILLEQMLPALCEGDDICGPEGSTQALSATAEAQEICESFASVSYGDGIYGAVVALQLRPCLTEPLRVAVLKSLSALAAIDLLPPAETVFGTFTADFLHDERNQTPRMYTELNAIEPKGTRRTVLSQLIQTIQID